eukprot:scaffold1339_cov207-Alexandrium_tamarense.AAC.31
MHIEFYPLQSIEIKYPHSECHSTEICWGCLRQDLMLRNEAFPHHHVSPLESDPYSINLVLPLTITTSYRLTFRSWADKWHRNGALDGAHGVCRNLDVVCLRNEWQIEIVSPTLAAV